MKKLLSILLIFPLFFAFPAPAKAQAPLVYASGCAVMEQVDRHPVYALNESARLPPASTTKIMTALIVLERTELSRKVTVSANAAGTEGSSAYLRAGEVLTVEELLFCLMLQSANDAATALAESVAGSVAAFADLMNEKAQALGLRNTHFTNPHGLDDEDHYTSAADLAALTCFALENERFAKLVSTKRMTVGRDENARTFVNHNRLLFTLPGCIGVKTGYTIRSGRCLVSACRRNDTTLVCVTLSCRDDWDAHTALYDYCFSRVRRLTVGETEISLPLINGQSETLTLRAQGCSLLSSPDSKLEAKIVCPHFLFAPTTRGEIVGEAVFLLDGVETARRPLICAEDAPAKEKKGFIQKLIDRLRGG